MGGRTRYETGTFCWVGLATSDPVAAKTFYKNLFGWRAEDLAAGAAGAFTMLRQGGKDVAFLHRQTPEARAAGAPPHWTSYISVEDAAVATRAAPPWVNIDAYLRARQRTSVSSRRSPVRGLR
jgi:uncharacterized protein